MSGTKLYECSILCLALCVLILPNVTVELNSCIDAGYNTCCTTGACAGEPPICYCDALCHRIGDCCNDITEICPQSSYCSSSGPFFRLERREGNRFVLEVCLNNVWGLLCDDDSWDDNDTVVACRQLGYETGDGFVSDFEDLPVHLLLQMEVNCSGTETLLVLCPLDFKSLEAQSECKGYPGVVCQGCTNGEIQLVDSYINGEGKEGRLEICLNNTWGALCSSSWDDMDTAVACRQLGYFAEASIPADFGLSSRWVHQVDVQCSGTEMTLSECLSVGESGSGLSLVPAITDSKYCSSHAGVICEATCTAAGVNTCCLSGCVVPSDGCSCNYSCPFSGNCCRDLKLLENCTDPVCEERDIRLVGGTDDSSGRVEICLLGQWGTVCDYFWDNDDAAVVCRQLGLESEGAFALRRTAFGVGDGRIVLDEVLCTGNESSLVDCQHRGVGIHNCFPSENAGVICAGLCLEGDIRLADGFSNSSGRVEVCFSGVWGTVCDSSWDNLDASIVCKQLGLNVTNALGVSGIFPAGTGLIFLNNVGCTGAEGALTECASVIGPIHGCAHVNDAGVICRQALEGIEAVSVGFEQLVYIFEEGTVGNQVCIATNGTLTPDVNRIFLDVQSEDISTLSNSDYGLVSVHEVLDMNRKCVTIEIQANDLDCESEESFLLHLEIPIGREYVELVYQTTTGVILDSNSLIFTANALYPSGLNEGDVSLQLQPNGLAPPFVLSQSLPLFGSNQSTLFVDPNGILSFQSPVTSRPISFPVVGITAIAPFWIEVAFSRLANIYYRETTKWCLLKRAQQQIRTAFTSTPAQSFFPTVLFIATWQVYPPPGTSEVYNSFQVVLASDGEMTYALLVYEMIQWGERSDSAAGLNAGDGVIFVSLPAPLAEDSNVGTPGIYIYRVDLLNVLNPNECIDGDIRRMEDPEGLIEICVRNTWARLCADYLEQSEATVACRQLGFSAENASIVSSGVTEESFILFNVPNCTGEENNIIECLATTVPDLTSGSCDYSGLSCTAIRVSLTQENYTVGEGEGSVSVCATLNQTITRTVVVRLATVEAAAPSSGLNQAKANRDYITTASQFIFRPTTGQQLQCANITIIDDSIFERKETLLVVLSSPTQGVQPDPQYAFITILDNDVVAVQFATASYVVGEQAGSVSLCLEKVGEAEVDFEVKLTTLTITGDSAAEAGKDFIAVNETVVVAAGSNRIFKIVEVLDDKIAFEGNEEFLVELITFESGVETRPNGNPTTVTIMDNDKVLLKFSHANYDVNEDSGNVTVCVRKDLEVAMEFSVTVLSRESSPVDATDGRDFYAIAIPLVFPSGNTNTVCEHFGIIDDDIALEAREQFSLDLLVPLIMSLQGSFELGLSTASINCIMGEEEIAVNSSTVTIIDNDVLILNFTSLAYSVSEDAGSVSVCLEKNKAIAEELHFSIFTNESDSVEATSTQDFTAISKNLTFPVGDQHRSCVDIQILDDTLALEGDERFFLQFTILTLTHNITIGQPNTSYVIIIDNDDLTVQFTQNEYEVLESVGSVAVCLDKDKDTAQDFVATITASEGGSSTATAGEDFMAISENISFPSNKSRVCINITIVMDDVVEEEEYFLVWFDISSDVHIIPGINTSLVIITEIHTDERSFPAGAVGAAVVCLTIIAVSIVLIFAVRHRRLQQKLKKHRTSLIHPEQKGTQNQYVMFRRQTTLSVMSMHVEELPNQLLIPSNVIRLLDSIGEGEFGLVYKAHIVWPKRTETVAVKTLKGFFDQNQINDMLKESLKMWKFNHPNVLTLTGVCIDGGPAPYIVMPFMANGSLLSYLKKERSSLILTENDDPDVIFSTSKRMMDMCFQVTKGMEYLASQKFVHKDLAARNCMIDLHFVIKIADFGLSENIYDRNYVRQEKGAAGKLPVKWMALESLTDLVFSEKTDVWAFGVTCWEVFSGGKVPYPAVDPVSLPSMLQSGYRAEKPNNATCSEEMYTIMLKCWKENPEERPEFSELVACISQQLESVAGYMDVSTFGGQQESVTTADVLIENKGATEQYDTGTVGSWRLEWPELYNR